MDSNEYSTEKKDVSVFDSLLKKYWICKEWIVFSRYIGNIPIMNMMFDSLSSINKEQVQEIKEEIWKDLVKIVWNRIQIDLF